MPVLDASSEADADWDYFPHPFYHRLVGHSRVTHGPVLPLTLAATINQYDDTLYRFCHAVSHQFTRRYFHMHDLDFRDSAIQAIKSYPSKVGSPNVVMVLRLGPIGQELPESVSLPETYQALE